MNSAFDHSMFLLVCVGAGFDVPSSLAIRFSVGVYLLIIVLFVNLFNGVLKANFSSQKKENINGIPDLLKVPDIKVFISELVEDSVKPSTEMKTLWHQRETKTQVLKARDLLSGKQIWFGDLPTLQMGLLMHFGEPKLKALHFHLGSAKYLQQPLVLPINNATMNPKALKYINKSQITAFDRLFERDFHIELEAQHSTAENEVNVLGFKDIEAKFRLWAAMLGVASFIFTFELLTRFQFREPLHITRMKRRL